MLPRPTRVLPLVIATALSAALGCSNQGGAVPNPFASADRVPPPPTRVPMPGTAVPNYMNGPVNALAVPSMPAPAFGTPATTTPALPASTSGFGTPPTTFAPQSTAPMIGGGLSDAGSTVSVPTDSGALRFEQPPMLAREQPLVELAARNLPPGTNLGSPTVAPSSPSNPYAASPASPRVRLPESLPTQPVVTTLPPATVRQRPAIMELPTRAPSQPWPVVDQTADGFRARSPARDTFTTPAATAPSGFVAPSAAGSTGYGYGPSYAQLRGRLEYNPAIGYWKLRYIPIDGASDEFGGTVAISNADRLAGYQPGDWVVVSGQLNGAPTSNGSYTAVYAISDIQRQ